MSLARRFVFSLVLALAPALAAADAVITVETSTDAYTLMGREQPARKSTNTIWIGETAARLDAGDTTTILDQAGGHLLVLDRADRTYSRVTLPVDLRGTVDEETFARMEQSKPMMRMSTTIRPSDETRKFGEYRCRKTTAEVVNPLGLTLSIDVWSTADLGLDDSIYDRLVLALAELQPSGGAWIEPILSIEGFPVVKETTVKLMEAEIRTVERFVSVEQRPAPEGHYAAPPDYALEEFDVESVKPLIRQ
jgi:hypothetical protein